MLGRSSLSRTGSFRPENLGQNALAMIGNLCFTMFVLGVLIFTIIAATYEPEDPLFHPSTKITTFLTSNSNATFKSDNTVVRTGEDFMAPNQTAFDTFINLTDVENITQTVDPGVGTIEKEATSCENSVDSPVDCRDPEVFHMMMRATIEHFKDIHFYRFGKPVPGSNDSTCDMAWRFRPKDGKTAAFYKDYRRFVISRSENCTLSVVGIGDYHTGVNARKRKKNQKPGFEKTRVKQGQVISLPVVGEAVNDALPVVESEGSFSRGKYLLYTDGGDRCKSMNHYLWSFLCALGEAQYLNRTLVMDLSICLSSIYSSSNQNEEGKDFRFYFDFEHLKESASVLDQGQFWSDWKQWQKKDGLNLHLVEDFRVTGKEKGKGKGKVRNKKGPANFQRHPGSENNNRIKEAARNDKVEIANSENDGEKDEINLVVAGGFCESTGQGASIDEPILRKHTSQELNSTGSRTAKPLPPVHFYALESDQPILDILKPSVIIVYHPDMTFVREIEVYKAENPSKKLKVYFLFYEDSTEVQKFEASIRRENGAFESLIRQKSMMIIPVDQDGRCLGLNSSVEPQASSSQNSITRKAGGRKEIEKEMQIIVDMREFMSSLPNVLHQKGMRIIPVTLEVGDYILSPLICVERKSIQDLFMSFTSGRLYHQVETMVRYYRIPVLLIEFSQDKSFSFQSASDIGDDVTPNSIISKLSLLALHFPRLRIIWSRSLHATAEIFASLKANQDEPDDTKAIRVGVPSEDGIVEDDVRAENYNTSAIEFLRRLPGVTDSNYRAIMEGCNSLAELALLPVERLAELMGGQKAARTLREFLDAKYPTLL